MALNSSPPLGFKQMTPDILGDQEVVVGKDAKHMTPDILAVTMHHYELNSISLVNIIQKKTKKGRYLNMK